MTRKTSRLYWKRERAYADFRDYKDVGGKQEALVAPGENFATKSPDEAAALLAARLEELKELRRRQQGKGDPTLLVFAKEFLKLKQRSLKEKTLKEYARALRNLLKVVGRSTKLRELDASTLNRFVAHRQEQVSAATAAQELKAVHAMLEVAHRMRLVSHNEASNVEKPRVRQSERDWLEVGEAARFLTAAQEMVQDPQSRCYHSFDVVVATFLLTGGRKREVFGLEVEDVDEAAQFVRFRPNSWRDLKTASSRRTVPLWPQLVPFLRRRLEESNEGLLFPSYRGKMLKDLSHAFDEAAQRADLGRRVTRHMLRHTYTAARIQTLDGGAPVSLYTVAKELGHTNLKQLESTYGHLLKTRHRSPVVEYRETEVVPLRREA